MSNIELVRQNVDIVQVVGEVVLLQRRGANFVGLCPFHQEKTPSFTVSASKQFFHCFGCKAGGDVFKFVQLYYRWEFTEVLKELARRAGVEIKEFKQDPQWEEGLHILELAMTAFKECLGSSKGTPFKNYLKERGIPQLMWEGFHLGAHGCGSQWLSGLLKQKRLNRDIAVSLGLLSRRGGEYYDCFQERLLFPILDEKGKMRGFGGRTLGNDQPKYLNSPKSTHFDKGRLFYGMHLASSHIQKKDYIVLVEGYLDVIALYEYGICNVLGSMGTALTMEQIRLLKRWSYRVISLYDGDRAGLLATEKNLGNFLQEGIESKVILLPQAKDPDAFLHDTNSTPEQKKQLLKEAFEHSTLALDFLVTHSVLVEKSPMGQGQKLRKLVNILDRVPDDLQRSLLKKDIARRFELPENLLFHESSPEPVKEFLSFKEEKGGEGRLERHLLRFCIEWGQTGSFEISEIIPFLSSTARWGTLLLNLLQQGMDAQTIAHLTWLGNIDEDFQVVIRQWVLEPKPDLAESDVLKMWHDLVKRLKMAYFYRESKRLQDELKIAEHQNNEERARGLLVEKRDLVSLFKALSPKSKFGIVDKCPDARRRVRPMADLRSDEHRTEMR